MWFILSCQLISRFYTHSNLFLSIDIQPLILIWFSALQACSSVQPDRDLLSHVLHINGIRHCDLISPPPGAASPAPGQQLLQLQAAAKAPVVSSCCTCAGCWCLTRSLYSYAPQPVPMWRKGLTCLSNDQNDEETKVQCWLKDQLNLSWLCNWAQRFFTLTICQQCSLDWLDD